MRIHHLNCATLCPAGQRWVAGRGSPFARGRMVCHCWLIETKYDGLVLVDTGLGLADCADVAARLSPIFQHVAHPIGDPEETAVRQVLRLGFALRDVRHIIPTHLDLDHAGGLSDFPEAKVHILRAEKQAALEPPTFRERARYRPVQFEHSPRWVEHDVDGERWKGFDAVRTISPQADVMLVPLPGHTRGHCGIAARDESGWLLHAGDAYFHGDEMLPSPNCPAGLAIFQRWAAVNNRQRLANQARLRELVSTATDVRVHCAHSPSEFEALCSTQAFPTVPRSPAPAQ